MWKFVNKFIVSFSVAVFLVGCTASVGTVIKYMHPILDKYYEMAQDSLKEVSESKEHTNKTLTVVYPDENVLIKNTLKNYKKTSSLNKYSIEDRTKMAKVGAENSLERMIPIYIKSIRKRNFFKKVYVEKNNHNLSSISSDYIIFLDYAWYIESTKTKQKFALPMVNFNLVNFNADMESFYKDNEAYIATRNYQLKPQDNLKQDYIEVRKEYSFKTTNIQHRDSFALVIGINRYKLNSNVEYADLSAMAFSELLNTTFGIPKENIISLYNESATSGQIKAKIALIKELSEKDGNLYIYFAGHGVPGKDGNTYILPTDMSADNIYLERNLQLDNIYRKLSKSDAKNVFIFMDTCFSGKDSSGNLLYKGVAPVLKTKKMSIPNDKLVVFTAGKSTDFANDVQSKKQRMFSYYLIKELNNGTKDLSEVYLNVRLKVKRKSLMKGIGYKQIPQLYGNRETILY